MDNNSLNHAGIKGMRWGVRRYQNSDGTLTDAGKKRYSKRTPDSEDHIKAKALNKKKLRQLSNDELRTINNRLQLETQYKDLKSKKVSKGRKVVNGILVGAATAAVTPYAQKYAKVGVEYVGKKAVTAAKKAAATAVVVNQINKFGR